MGGGGTSNTQKSEVEVCRRPGLIVGFGRTGILDKNDNDRILKNRGLVVGYSKVAVITVMNAKVVVAAGGFGTLTVREIWRWLIEHNPIRARQMES